MAIPGEAGWNRPKDDSRHCRGHNHLEVRLWFRKVNRQLFVYLEWANGMLEQRRLPLTSQCQPCLFIIATAHAKHVALFILDFYCHMDLGLELQVLT